MLVIPSLWKRLFFRDRLQELGIKFAHLKCGRCNRQHPAERFEQPDLVSHAVTQGGRDVLVLFRTAVESGFAIPFAVSSYPAVFTAVIVAFRLVFEHIVLIVHELMLFRFDRYTHMLISRIAGVFNRLYSSFLPVCKPDREHRFITLNSGASAF